MRLLTCLVVFALACDGEKVDSGHGSLGVADSGSNDCSGTPPEITDFTAEDGGEISGEGGGDTQPSVLLRVTFNDDDGDAHIVSMDIWYDDVIDGLVDVSGEAKTGTDPSALTDKDGNVVQECAGTDATLGVKLGVTGTSLAYSTEYDWAAVVYDNAGLASEPAFVTAPTPAAL